MSLQRLERLPENRGRIFQVALVLRGEKGYLNFQVAFWLVRVDAVFLQQLEDGLLGLLLLDLFDEAGFELLEGRGVFHGAGGAEFEQEDVAVA